MFSTRAVIVSLLAICATGCAENRPSPDALTSLSGIWTSQTGNVDVAITPCAQALCGDVVKVHGNVSMSDPSHPAKGEPAKEGMRIFSDLKPAGPSRWRGKIFNREENRTYDCVLTSLNSKELEVHPYIVVELIGKTQIWQSASAAAAAK